MIVKSKLWKKKKKETGDGDSGFSISERRRREKISRLTRPARIKRRFLFLFLSYSLACFPTLSLRMLVHSHSFFAVHSTLDRSWLIFRFRENITALLLRVRKGQTARETVNELEGKEKGGGEREREREESSIALRMFPAVSDN